MKNHLVLEVLQGAASKWYKIRKTVRNWPGLRAEVFPPKKGALLWGLDAFSQGSGMVHLAAQHIACSFCSNRFQTAPLAKGWPRERSLIKDGLVGQAQKFLLEINRD